MTNTDWKSEIVAICAEAYGVTVKDVMGRGRPEKVANARQLAMTLLYERGMTCSQVGRYFDRDHCTVLNGVKMTEARLLWPGERERIARIKTDCEHIGPEVCSV